MGRDFGDLLGLPQALPDMPLSPLVPGWAELRATERAAGFRHAADALLPPGSTRGAPGAYFQILDGLRVPGRGGRRRHVDRALLAEVRDAALRAGVPDPVRSLFARYDAALAEHPMGLRRVVLYQLLQLLRDAPRGPSPEAATALGVDPAEAAALAHAARRAARSTPAARAAAETLVDAWRAGHTRRAHALTRQLPVAAPAPVGDQRLAHLVARVKSRARRADALLLEAHTLERRAATDEAAEHYLRALRTAEDDTDALHGLLRASRPTTLRTEVGPDGVRLRWPTDAQQPPADRTWRLLRGAVGRDEWTELTTLPAPTSGGGVLVDEAAPLGERVRYAALPLDGDRIAGRPLVSAEVLVAPEVSDVTLTDSRARVDARWRTPPGTHRVTAVRTGPDPAATDVPVGPHGFTDQGLPPGEHRYRIHCVYRTAAGREVRSPGVAAHRTVHPWPDPVTGLTVRQGDTPGVLNVEWTGGARGQVRLLDWPGPPPAPGEDLRTPAADLPPELGWPPCGAPRAGSAAYRPPTGAATRVTAVTVLGDRAVAGPSVRVDVPEGVPELTARRVEPTRARLTFDWPRATDRVLVRWWQSDTTHERRLTRSTYLREGLHLTLTRAAARFRVEPLAVADADVVVPPASAETSLPADLAISYALDRPGFLTARRRRVTVRADTPESAGPVGETGEAAPELPEFVLVARAGSARRQASDPPRTVRDGMPVLRLSGAELLAGPVLRDLDTAVADAGVRRPYTLRAFLTGPHAHAVRLEEPPHNDLVVR